MKPEDRDMIKLLVGDFRNLLANRLPCKHQWGEANRNNSDNVLTQTCEHCNMIRTVA